MRYWIDVEGKEHRDNDMPTLDLKKYHLDDFKGLKVIENGMLRPYEIVVMVGKEIMKQIKADDQKQ